MLIFTLAVFQVLLWLSLEFLKVWLLLHVLPFYMYHFNDTLTHEVFSLVSPGAAMLLTDSEEELG